MLKQKYIVGDIVKSRKTKVSGRVVKVYKTFYSYGCGYSYDIITETGNILKYAEFELVKEK